jgi:hypothetical protein
VVAIPSTELWEAPVKTGYNSPAEAGSTTAPHDELGIATTGSIVVCQLLTRMNTLAGYQRDLVFPPKVWVATVVREVV